MYNIILPLNFPHIYLHGVHLIKPQQTSHNLHSSYLIIIAH